MGRKIVDVSTYQGVIDWREVASHVEYGGGIVRTTTKDGKLDNKFIANSNGIINNIVDGLNPNFTYYAGYKFAYTRDHMSAYIEASKTLYEIEKAGFLQSMGRFYLDLEKWGGRDYKTNEATEVIKGYREACADFKIPFGLYCNYNYIKHIIDPMWSKNVYLWLARYNNVMGDVSPWSPRLWQYTSKGRVSGIDGNVDISEVII